MSKEITLPNGKTILCQEDLTSARTLAKANRTGQKFIHLTRADGRQTILTEEGKFLTTNWYREIYYNCYYFRVQDENLDYFLMDLTGKPVFGEERFYWIDYPHKRSVYYVEKNKSGNTGPTFRDLPKEYPEEVCHRKQ